MKFSELINQHGQTLLVNGAPKKARIVKDFFSDYKNIYIELTGLRFIKVLVSFIPGANDVFEFDKKKYLLYLSDTRFGIFGSELAYCALKLFEDDFTHDIEIKRAMVEGEPTSPAKEQETILSGLKARIKQMSPEQALKVLYENSDGVSNATHIITIKFNPDEAKLIREGYSVLAEEKSFEILGLTNLDNKSKLLLMSCREVFSERQ